MVNPSEIHGKRIAMIAWGRKPDGSDDVAVFTGTADWDGTQLTMLREPGELPVHIPAEWLERLRPVEPDLKSTLLDAQYCFSVSVGDLPDDDIPRVFAKTGLKWPNGGAS